MIIHHNFEYKLAFLADFDQKLFAWFSGYFIKIQGENQELFLISKT